MNNSQKSSYTPLVAQVIEGILDVKGENIKVLDLRNLENAVCQFFVICDGNSNTQVSAIANAVEKRVREELKDKPWHVEGADTATWILMDYVSVAVHVFQKDVRSFYDLEGMWDDAEVSIIEESIS